VLGMNFRVGLFEHAWLFWVVLGAIAALAVAMLAAARARDWI
jgi:Mg2+ and Co2+ transporter CorA